MPQGSCLGPLLFLLYINDLSHALNASLVSMYADDTSLCFEPKDLKALNVALNEDLQRLDYWLQGNKLSLNVVKTKSLLVASSQKQKHFLESGEKLALEIRGRDIEATPHIKYLGIYVDHTLDWKKQIQLITMKVSRALGILNYSKHSFQFESLKTLYTSIIEPHLRNFCAVWGCCGKAEIDRLQKLQNRAARIVTYTSYDALSMPLIRSLGWETIDNLINHEVKAIAFKSVDNLAPQYMINLFTGNSLSSSHNLRNIDSDVQMPKKEKTPNGQKCFSYRGDKI